MESPFDVLLVDPGADEAQIEQAYRERVKEAHPDQGGSVEEFRAVRTAYETLKAGPDGQIDGVAEGASDGRNRPEAVASRVTYLDYDAVTDAGWSLEGNPFRRAADADLDEADYGQFEVRPGESLLEAAENRGYAWPFACRGGACANCAIVLLKGELSMPVDHILPSDLMEQGIRLSCNGMPITDELHVVYNVKHMPELEDLLLPPHPFEQAYPND